MGRLASTLGKPLYMDEATASGSRVDYARVCIEIEASFTFPRYTHTEVDGVQEDIAMDYDWEPKPCIVCSSFEHEHGSCVTMATTLATMEDIAQNMPRATVSKVGEKCVEKSTPPLTADAPGVIQREHMGMKHPTIL